MTQMKTWQRRTLGILALGGGFLGVVMILIQVIAGTMTAGVMLLHLPFVALYAWGTWCGLLLIEGQPVLRRNRWFWMVQVPYCATPIITYLFYAGVAGLAAFNFSAMRIRGTMVFGSQFQFNVNHPTDWELGINVFALAIALWIWRLERRPALVLEEHQPG
jgi:hypothetical protein